MAYSHGEEVRELRFRILSILALMLLGSCSEGPGIEPPEIMFGVDACDECKMIVSEDRYACAIVVEDSEARYQPVSFDDIGCMFDYVSDKDNSKAVALYVVDYNSKQWLDATAAFYLHSSELNTPMASGVAYFQSKPDAEELSKTHPGDILDFESLKKRHANNGLSLSSIGSVNDDSGDS